MCGGFNIFEKFIYINRTKLYSWLIQEIIITIMTTVIPIVIGARGAIPKGLEGHALEELE